MIFGFQPFGWAPFGYYIPGEDLSIPSPVTSLLANPGLFRTYLLLARPYDYIAGERVDIILSTDGYASWPDDTLPDDTVTLYANRLFRAALLSPYNARNAVMSGGSLSADPLPSQGDTTIENASGRFRHLLKLEWDAAYCQVLLGRPEFSLSQFTPIFTGVTGTINSSTVDEIHLPLLDNSRLLRKPIIPDIYRGMGAAIRGNGSTGYATGSLDCPEGAVTIELRVRPLSSASTSKVFCGWRNGSGVAGQRILRFSNTGANALEALVTNDAGTTYTVPGMTPLSTFKLHHIALTLDPAENVIFLYVNPGTNTEQAISQVTTGTFNTFLDTFSLMRLPDTSAQFADIDIDEVRVWDIALSRDEIIANKDREIPPTTDNLYAYYRCNEGTGDTLFSAVLSKADLTLSGGYSWVGSLEGGPDIAGQTPPVWEGLRRQVEPVNVDPQNYVYEVSRNPTGAITVSDVQDSGSPSYTMDSPVSDIYAWSPVAGHCVTAYMDGRTLLRLEAAPQGTLTVTVTSDTLDTAAIVKKLAKTYGGFTDSQIDLLSFALTTASYPATVGIGSRLEPRHTWDMMQEVARKAGGWVTMTRQGLLTIKILSRPSVPKFRITENDVQVGGVALVARTQAVKSVRLGYRPYSTTQTSDLATSLTEAEKADLGQPLRYTSPTPVDVTLLSARPDALDLIQETLYDDEDDAYQESLRRAEIWGRDCGTWVLPFTVGLFQYQIGDEIICDIREENGEYVENLREHKLVIVEYIEDPKLDTINVFGWGEIPTPIDIIATDEGEGLGTDDDEGIGAD